MTTALQIELFDIDRQSFLFEVCRWIRNNPYILPTPAGCLAYMTLTGYAVNPVIKDDRFPYIRISNIFV